MRDINHIHFTKDQLYAKKQELPIKGIYHIDLHPYPDDRGSFTEIFKIRDITDELSPTFKVSQINHAYSKEHVARGFHAENWNKYVTVLHGVAYKVLLDIRPDSPTFLTALHLNIGKDVNALDGALFIPAGIANSVCVTKGPLDYIYAVDRLYEERDKSGDRAISLFDPDLNIKWPIPHSKMKISKRDVNAVLLRDVEF